MEVMLRQNRKFIFKFLKEIMHKRKKIILQDELNDQQGFDYNRHGIKMSTKNEKNKRQSAQDLSLKILISNQRSKSSDKSIYTLQTISRKDTIKENSSNPSDKTFIEKDLSPPNHNTNQTLQDETAKELAITALAQSNNPLLRTNNKRRKKEINLKQLISKNKVDNLTKKFAQKIQLNNSHSQPVYYEGFNIQNQSSFFKKQGFQSPLFLDNLFGLVTILIILFAVLEVTLSLVFQQIRNSTFFDTIQIMSLIFFFLDVFYASVTVKSQAGKKLKTLEEILQNYLQTTLIIDIVNIIIISLDISIHHQVILFFRLFIITKIPQSLQKLEKLQVSFIKNYYNEQYWSLVKVVLFNFCFAHVIAICLTAMAKMNPNRNWHTQKNISHNWSSQYIWGYYWAVNIMLTVGFGDLSATTDVEALCLIFVEIFAVMCLAYNINWIGTLISNIRAQDIEKGRNFKTFKQLSDKYSLPSQLDYRISNYIEESVNIRKKFNLQEEKAFVQSLPSTMKKDYLKESNKSIFQELPFFSSLVDKTLYNFAEKIEMTISHPQQVLRRKDDDYNLLILRQGEIGFTAKLRNCKFNDMVIDKVKVSNNQKPFVLGLEFLTRTKPIYQVKSLQYSVVYSLSYDELISILQESSMDYLLFCLLRDKNKSTMDEFQVFPCEICKKGKKHTKFTCPKLHYTPLAQMVIHKQNHKIKRLKNKRISQKQYRDEKQKISALLINKEMLQILQNGDIKISNMKNRPKINNPFIDQINKMKNLKNVISAAQIMTEDSSQLSQDSKNTSDVIKQQLDRYFKSDAFEDQIWLIGCDKAKNYKEYFPEGNPCNLEQNFNVQDRINALQLQKQRKAESFKIGSFDFNQKVPSLQNDNTEIKEVDSQINGQPSSYIQDTTQY